MHVRTSWHRYPVHRVVTERDAFHPVGVHILDDRGATAKYGPQVLELSTWLPSAYTQIVMLCTRLPNLALERTRESAALHLFERFRARRSAVALGVWLRAREDQKGAALLYNACLFIAGWGSDPMTLWRNP